MRPRWRGIESIPATTLEPHSSKVLKLRSVPISLRHETAPKSSDPFSAVCFRALVPVRVKVKPSLGISSRVESLVFQSQFEQDAERPHMTQYRAYTDGKVRFQTRPRSSLIEICLPRSCECKVGCSRRNRNNEQSLSPSGIIEV